MLVALRWLNVKSNALNFIQKIKVGEAPEYLTGQLNYVGETQPYRLINANNFRLQRADTNVMQKCIIMSALLC